MSFEENLFTSGGLTIHRSTGKQQYTLLWKGECDFRNPTEILGPTLNGLLPELRDQKLRLDFRRLTFMNSSSVMPILAFVRAACSKAIPVHLIYNADLGWQRTTASSMRAIGRSLKILTVEVQSAEDTLR